MLKKFVFLFCLSFILISTTFAFSADISKANEEIQSLEKQMVLINQRVEFLEKYNDEVLDNIKWIFGLAVTIILFILGGFSIFTVRITDRDLKIIKEELKQEHNNKFEELIEKFNNYKNELEDYFNEEMDDIEEKNDIIINRKIKHKVSSLEEKIRSLNVDLLLIKVEGSESKLPMFQYRKIVENAAGIYKQEYVIARILKEIEEELDKHIELELFDEEELNILLKYVPEKFENQKLRISRKLKGI